MILIELDLILTIISVIQLPPRKDARYGFDVSNCYRRKLKQKKTMPRDLPSYVTLTKQ